MADTFYPGFAVEVADPKEVAREEKKYARVVRDAIRDELSGLKAARAALKKAKPKRHVLECVKPGADQPEVCRPRVKGKSANGVAAAKAELAKKRVAVEKLIRYAEKRLAKAK